MQIGIPREVFEGEQRVAATPKTVPQLMKLGYSVVIETGAGDASSFPDSAYSDAGASVDSADAVWGSDVVLAVNAPVPEELAKMHEGATLVSLMAPAQHKEMLDAFKDKGITALAMDAVPRISRAQSLDALSSMANISGYRAVIEAATNFGRFFTGQVTAAGKVPPAKVLVVGAGVAGLAAIGAAHSLGAIVRATDARAEVADQVKSMGGDFLTVEVSQAQESSDGYARETSDEFNRKSAELYSEQAKDVDIIITTASAPGKKAPVLITEDMVASMQPGSVIVDLGAASGGNCAVTEPGKKIVTDNGVTVIGYTDFPSRLPGQSSQLYGTNLVNLLKLTTPEKDGEFSLDFDDEVQRGVTVTKDHDILWPPPPIKVSAAPAAAPAKAPEPEAKPEKKPRDWRKTGLMVALGAVIFLALSAISPADFMVSFAVFALACVVGYYVVWRVSSSLHTPLMSVTNAISGIIIVGAIFQITTDNWLVKIIATLGVVIASINIFGGFSVTARMLKMFKKA